MCALPPPRRFLPAASHAAYLPRILPRILLPCEPPGHLKVSLQDLERLGGQYSTSGGGGNDADEDDDEDVQV